jgi:hypothetical protein
MKIDAAKLAHEAGLTDMGEDWLTDYGNQEQAIKALVGLVLEESAKACESRALVTDADELSGTVIRWCAEDIRGLKP